MNQLQPCHPIDDELFVLARSGTSSSVKQLRHELASSSPSTRSTAAELLLLCKPGESIRDVIPLLWDSCTDVSIRVAVALGWHGGQFILEHVAEEINLRGELSCRDAQQILSEILLTPCRAGATSSSELVQLHAPEHDIQVALIGPSGVGKSTVGRLLANRLGIDFVDSDELVERAVGLSSFEAFRILGEYEYRKVETGVLISQTKLSSRVVAVGAGAIGTDEGRSAIGRFSETIELTVAPSDAMTRLLSDATTSNAVGQLYQLHTAFDSHARVIERYRKPLYARAAKAVVETGGLDPVAVAEELLYIVLGKSRPCNLLR